MRETHFFLYNVPRLTVPLPAYDFAVYSALRPSLLTVIQVVAPLAPFEERVKELC
jgi:hypothetical protein